MSNTEILETAKTSLYNSEQIANIKSNPVVKATILTVLNAIPCIGELIDGTIDITLTKFQETKRNELLNIILSDYEHITSEMVNDVEFILNFAKTLEAVNKLATNDKVKYFGNLLKNGYLSGRKIANDEFDEFLYILSVLSYREINYLFFLYEFQKSNFEIFEDKHKYYWEFDMKFAENFDMKIGASFDIFKKLCSTGLVEKYSKTGMISVKKYDDGYFEDFTGESVDIYPEFYYITENFKKIARKIGGDTYHE